MGWPGYLKSTVCACAGVRAVFLCLNYPECYALLTSLDRYRLNIQRWVQRVPPDELEHCGDVENGRNQRRGQHPVEPVPSHGNVVALIGEGEASLGDRLTVAVSLALAGGDAPCGAGAHGLALLQRPRQAVAQVETAVSIITVHVALAVTHKVDQAPLAALEAAIRPEQEAVGAVPVALVVEARVVANVVVD